MRPVMVVTLSWTSYDVLRISYASRCSGAWNAGSSPSLDQEVSDISVLLCILRLPMVFPNQVCNVCSTCNGCIAMSPLTFFCCLRLRLSMSYYNINILDLVSHLRYARSHEKRGLRGLIHVCQRLRTRC